MIRRVLATAAAAAVLASCGGGDGEGRFDAQVATVRAAVEAGDRDAALTALDGIAVQVLGAHQDGVLSDAEAEELGALVAQGRALVDEELPSPTTQPPPTTTAPSTTAPTTTAPTTTAPPPPVLEDEGDDEDDDEGGEGRGARKDKDKDKDKDEDEERGDD